MKSRPTSSHRTTQRIRLVDGTPKPFGEVEFSDMPGRPYMQLGVDYQMCKSCGNHLCSCSIRANTFAALEAKRAAKVASQSKCSHLFSEEDSECYFCHMPRPATGAPNPLAEVANDLLTKPPGLGCIDPTPTKPPDQQRVQAGGKPEPAIGQWWKWGSFGPERITGMGPDPYEDHFQLNPGLYPASEILRHCTYHGNGDTPTPEPMTEAGAGHVAGTIAWARERLRNKLGVCFLYGGNKFPLVSDDGVRCHAPGVAFTTAIENTGTMPIHETGWVAMP